jgi:hypothetical protein
MPDIPATVPVVVPAVPEITYDLWGVESFRTDWPSLTGPLVCEAFFRSARRPSENEPLIAGPVVRSYRVADLWARAATRPKVAMALGLLIEALTEEATADGVL